LPFNATCPIANIAKTSHAVLIAHKVNPAAKQIEYNAGPVLSEVRNGDWLHERGNCCWKLLARRRKLYPHWQYTACGKMLATTCGEWGRPFTMDASTCIVTKFIAKVRPMINMTTEKTVVSQALRRSNKRRVFERVSLHVDATVRVTHSRVGKGRC